MQDYTLLESSLRDIGMDVFELDRPAIQTFEPPGPDFLRNEWDIFDYENETTPEFGRQLRIYLEPITSSAAVPGHLVVLRKILFMSMRHSSVTTFIKLDKKGTLIAGWVLAFK